MKKYDAVIVVSFGGPDGPDDVVPFLENVVRGKGVPKQRVMKVAEHYYHFGGKSPINEQNLALIKALKTELKANGPDLPVYYGNRNWHPLLTDTLRQMKEDGVQNAIAFFTSGFSCYSGCRQYREDIAKAQEEVGEGAPKIDLLRKFYNHPGFVEPMAQLTRETIQNLSDLGKRKNKVLFAAHSIPQIMADHCRYEEQLTESSRLIAELAGVEDWELVYQSRSGPPSQPWLEPDICDRIEQLKAEGYLAVTVVPVGFVSDHMEVLFDLDTEAVDKAKELNMDFGRVPTIGTNPEFVSMIAELIRERTGAQDEKRALGKFGPSHDVCPANCCFYPRTRPTAVSSAV